MILHKLRGKRKAFTLIELLVVVVIIGLLATLVVLAVINAKKKADTARAKDSVKKVYDAISIVIADAPAMNYSTAFRVVKPAASGINSGRIATQDGNNLVPEIPYDYTNNPVQYKLTTDATTGNVQIVVKGFGNSAKTQCWVVSNLVTANGVAAPASNLNNTTPGACPS